MAEIKWLSARETAAMLDVNKQTLAGWRKTNRYPDLPYARIGGLVKYKRADVERWLESRTVGTVEV